MGGDILQGDLSLARVCVHELEMSGKLLSGGMVLGYHSVGASHLRRISYTLE